MKTAKLFKNGQSQAVRLPKEFRFDGKEVYITRLNDGVLLLPLHSHTWEDLFEAATEFSEDFMAEREQPPVQTRSFEL